MHNLKIANYESLKEKVVGLDLDKMAQAYMDMGDINSEIAEQDYHLETEATYSIEKFIGVDIGSED